jgi:hypothetical protein
MFCPNRDPVVKNEMGGTCRTYGEKKRTGILWGKPEREQPFT